MVTGATGDVQYNNVVYTDSRCIGERRSVLLLLLGHGALLNIEELTQRHSNTA